VSGARSIGRRIGDHRVEDSVDEYGHPFPDLRSVSMAELVGHYVDCVEVMRLHIIRAYG
jgi:hypothetical protein